MCTVVVLRRPDHRWPLLLAANRDEMLARPWRPPGRHWPHRPEVVAGLDEQAGGSWLGLNDHGLVAGVLNRVGSLGPQPGKRSRGELVLEALDHADAEAAAEALGDLDPDAYSSFNMVVADNRDAYWLRHIGAGGPGHIERMPLPDGISMLTSRDRNDPRSPRIALHLPRFENAAAPDPETGDWAAWEALLASRDHPGQGPEEAMAIVTEIGFGTVSGSLIALPSVDMAGTKPIWRFVSGIPGNTPYQDVAA